MFDIELDKDETKKYTYAQLIDMIKIKEPSITYTCGTLKDVQQLAREHQISLQNTKKKVQEG